jgi:hypothetical protein
MAKTIKFNLIIDNNPVRNINELKDNFCVEDVIDLYNNRILQKWLKVRGYDEFLNEVDAIKEKNLSSILIKLINIFGIEIPKEKMFEDIYNYSFKNERMKCLGEMTKKNNSIKQIINEYHKKYQKLLQNIENKNDNIAYLKSAADEIAKNYFDTFEMYSNYVFDKYKDISQLFIYAILMNSKLRNDFLKDTSVKKGLEIFSLSGLKRGVNKSSLNKKVDLFNIIDNLNCINTVENNTENYWKKQEDEKSKVMILSISDDTFIKSAANNEKELSSKDINGNFQILSGLRYKSKKKTFNIIYMKI